MDVMSKNNCRAICRSLEEKQAGNVVALDMRLHCTWTDYLVIATANNPMHLKSLSATVRKCMQDFKMNCISGKGETQDSSWKMIGSDEIVVSIMDSKARDFYALEEVWFGTEIVYSQLNHSSTSS